MDKKDKSGAATQASIPAGWINAELGSKPEPRTPVLLYVRTLTRGEDDEGRPYETEGAEIAMGEWRANNGNPYFDCYTSPMSDNDWITHWMPLPAAPDLTAPAAPTSQAEPVVAGQQADGVDLHNAIMNLPCDASAYDHDPDQRLAYKIGHRDARHAAAELALAVEAAAPSSLPMAADARDQALEDRKLVLLKAAQELLHKQTESRYVLNLLMETVFYDDADCDGHCLMEDIGYLFDELDEKGQRPASQEGVSDE